MVNTTQRSNGFEASIVDARSKARTSDGDTYVCLRHGQQYRIGLRNNRSTRASVEVKIDGKSVGKWVLGPHASATIERPVDIAKKFTFYREDSGEAQSIGVISGADENGLVECIFIAEQAPKITPIPVVRPVHHHHHHHHHHDWSDDSGELDDVDVNCFHMGFGGMPHQSGCRPRSTAESRKKSRCRSAAPSQSVVAGATGLQGYSNQTFGRARQVDKDMSTRTSISFRLVIKLPDFRAPPRPPVISPLPDHSNKDVPAPPRPPAEAPQEKPSLYDEKKVQDLVDMGFKDLRMNRRLLVFFDGDIVKCVKELVRLEREQAEAVDPAQFGYEEQYKQMIEQFGFEGMEEECKAALIKFEGDINQAVRECVENLRSQ